MEACVDIFLKKPLSRYTNILTEEKYCLEGECFSYEPSMLKLTPGVSFEQIPPPKHITQRLEGQVKLEDFFSIHLKDGLVEVWETSINIGIDDDFNKIRLNLARLLEAAGEWVFVFELNCDQIDSTYEFSPTELIEKMDFNFNWNVEPEGFVAFSEKKET